MLTRQQSLHNFKVSQNKLIEYDRHVDKFGHILYKFVPKVIFDSNNILTKVFTNGLAILIAKCVSNVSWIEEYFELNNKRF
jgi:hypothetical protein